MKFLSLIGLAAIGSAVAYCPNLCSGHGKCGAQDTCVCYTYAGTTRGDYVGQYATGEQDFAWTGADCSQRTCPKAYSFSGATPYGLNYKWDVAADANAGAYTITLTSTSSVSGFFSGTDGTVISTGSGSTFSTGSKIRIVDTLYTIKSATRTSATVLTIDTYEALAANALAATAKAYTQSIEKDSGASVSYTAASADFGQWDANGAHDIIECAGQGICDRATGECKCFPGYEGEACTRTACPNQCSGHGTCLSAARLAADTVGVTGTDAGDATLTTANALHASQTPYLTTGTVYAYNTVWDSNKHYGCKCDLGYRGPDCSLQECPSDYDPLNGCGGGKCNLGKTYTSKDGTSTNCPTGNLGASDCATKDYLNRYEQRDCSGRGICDYTTGVCKCFSGFFGEACNIQTILV